MGKFSYFLSRNKGKIIGWVSFILVVSAVCIAIYFLNIMTTKADSLDSYNYNSKNDEDTKIVSLDNEKKDSNIKDETVKKEDVGKIKVDIKGSVKNAGVYELENDKRVIDAIEKAGGATKNADLSVTNLSKKLKDEMVIIVYSKDEVKNLINVKDEETVKNEDCIEKSPAPNSCIEDVSEESVVNQKISINSASYEELLTLNGIGQSRAQAIIEYRTKNNGFKQLEEIMNIDGIGQALFDKIKDDITL